MVIYFIATNGVGLILYLCYTIKRVVTVNKKDGFTSSFHEFLLILDIFKAVSIIYD